ncbi:MAG: hypothetical protein V9E82_14760 [Candidatus Nanopelagicales bacterium]
MPRATSDGRSARRRRKDSSNCGTVVSSPHATPIPPETPAGNCSRTSTATATPSTGTTAASGHDQLRWRRRSNITTGAVVRMKGTLPTMMPGAASSSP